MVFSGACGLGVWLARVRGRIVLGSAALVVATGFAAPGVARARPDGISLSPSGANSSATATCTPPAGLTARIYWTGATSSDWSTVTNWSFTDGGPSAGRLPGSSDFVCMSTSPTTSTVDLSSSTTSTVGGINFPVNGAVQPSLTVAGTLTIGNGTVTDTSSIDQLTINGGVLVSSSGEAAAAGSLTLTGGRLEGPGKLTVTGPATFGAGSVLGVNGTPSVAAHLVLQGASTLPASTQLDVFGSSVLENEGTLMLGDNSDINAGADNTNQVINDAGATITYTASASGKSASVGALATNRGTVTVGAGTLNFGAFAVGVSDSGAFDAAAGATLNLFGTRTEAAGATLSGLGTIDLQAPVTLTTASNLGSIGTFEVDGGTLIVASGQDVTAPNLTLASARLEGPGTLTVSGAASVNASVLGLSGTPSVAAHLVLQGASTMPANTTSDVFASSVLENEGTLTLADGSVLNAGTDTTARALNDAGATISYTGSASTKSATLAVALTNNGTVAANEGALVLDSLTNLSSTGNLSGGTYTTAGGVISLPHAVSTNGASVTLGASPSAFTVSGSGNALSSLTSNTGTLDLKGSLTLTGSLTNSGTGTVTIENFSTLTATTYTQTAGTTTVVGGSTLQSGSGSGNVAINGGTLAGTGTVSGDVLAKLPGSVRPAGTVTGAMSVTGTYDNSAGRLTIPISGTAHAGTDFGQLSVSGVATLGGTLTFLTKSGYVPPLGTTYTIVTAGSVGGMFTTISGALIGSTEKYVVSYPTPTTVVATVVPVPHVTGVSPAAGPTAGGTSVTISGSGFTGATAVKFGGTSAAGFVVNSDTQITATSPAEAAGTVDVTVTTPNGTGQTSSADRFSFDAAPTLTSIGPTAGPTTGGQKVTLTGTNFVSGATVQFGTSAASSVTLVSSTTLTALAPAHSAAPVMVTVTTPGGTTGPVSYTFDPQPTVSSLSPDAGSTAGGNTITINGSGFVHGATAKFSGTGSSLPTTFLSTTQITVAVPAHSAGVVNVYVTTPGGTSSAVTGDVYAFGAPTISSLSPDAGSTAGGNTITINGTGFAPGMTVQFSSVGASLPVTFVSGTQVTVVAPAHPSGAVNVFATTPAGTSAAVNGDFYAFGAPTISGVVPNSGSTAGGNTVTINGTGFVPGMTVKFSSGGASLPTTFVSGKQVTVIAPAHASGAVNLFATTPAGTSAAVSGDVYTFT